MPDIQVEHAVTEQTVLEQLEEKGWIEESFDGETEVLEDLVKILEPVFFGEHETRLEKSNPVNFHLYKSKITMAVMHSETINMALIDDETLIDLFEGEDIVLVSANVQTGYKELRFTAEEMFEEENIKRAIQFVKGEADESDQGTD